MYTNKYYIYDYMCIYMCAYIDYCMFTNLDPMPLRMPPTLLRRRPETPMSFLAGDPACCLAVMNGHVCMQGTIEAVQ